MLAQEPLFSIVTPCKNAAAYIEQCIQSVKLQRYQNFEHIIVDGGSTDETLDIIKRHASSYNTRWLSEEDGSPEEALNKGFALARGTILTLLPADDLFFPWTLMEVARTFEANHEADLVYGDFAVGPFGWKYASVFFAPAVRDIESLIRFAPIGWIFFTKSAGDALGGFDENLCVATDYDFEVRMFRRFKFAKADRLLAYQRERKDSISIAGRKEMAHEHRIIRTRYSLGPAESLASRVSEYYLPRGAYMLNSMIWLLFARDTNSRSEANCIGRDAISKKRLLRDIVFAPALYNKMLERRICHGYVNAQALLNICAVQP